MIDKFQGSLLGFAIGDALGAPIEDTVRNEIESNRPISAYTKAVTAHPLTHLEPGQYSDETQVMLAVAESLVKCKGFSPDDLGHRFIDWFQLQKLRSSWRFPSNTMMKACRKLSSGAHWSASGYPSVGSIPCVRSIPISLLYWRHPILLKNAIEKSCQITHTDPRVIAGAMIISAAIKMGLEEAEPSPDLIINLAIEKSQAYAQEIPKRLKTVRDCLRMEPSAALQLIGNTGFCMEAIPASLFFFFRNPKRFDDLIIEAANAGGDSDSIAAVAGAIFGAFNGIGSIPTRWLKPLEDMERIKQLGCDLARLAIPQSK